MFRRGTLSLLLLCTTTIAQVPSPSTFIRRNNHGSVAVGSFVYIDGGLYSTYNDNGSVWGPFPNTKTLAIDMRQSWTNTTVPMTEIDKGNSPVFFQPQFWPDPSTNTSFYSWSGGAPSGYTVSEKSLWKFTGDGRGGGSWARVAADPSFASLTRPVGGYNAVADGVGYFVGGYATGDTDDVAFEGGAAVPVPGVVSYNFSSGQWTNQSSIGWTSYGTGMRGQAAAVPFGGSGTGDGKGLVVLLGGESGTREAISNTRGYIEFSSVAIYDTKNASWHAQTTTGDAPSPRDEFCMAAAQGENSTELLVFGGWTVETGVTHSDAYVLSLPAFRWFKGPSNTSPRVGLTCHTVGSGGQVLVIGGQDNNNNTYRWENPDPWTQGLGIFNMSAMEWSDRYDADAPAYKAPQVVKDWYEDSSNAEPEWSSDTVKALFSRTTTGDSTETSSGDGAASSSATSSADGGATSKPNAGAIASGVIGGVAAAALIGFAFFYFRRRKQRTGPPKANNAIDELDSESMAELHARSLHVELPTKPHDRAELPGHCPKRVELPGRVSGTYGNPVELPTSRDLAEQS